MFVLKLKAIALLVFNFTASPIAVAVGKVPANEIVAEYQNRKKEMTALERNQRRVMGNIYQISNKIKNMAQKRERLVDRGLAIKGGIRILAKDIATLEDKIELSRYELSRRLRKIYTAGGRGVLHIIFSSSSAVELDRNLKFLKLVSQRDVELIRQYRQSIHELEFRKSQLKGKVRKLMLVKGHLEKQEKALEKTQKTKSRILSDLEKKKVKALGQLRGLRKKSMLEKRLKGNMQTALKEPIFERKGKLQHPIEATVTKKFGLSISKEYRYILGHKGLFYQAPLNSNVKSVFSGKVVYVGDLPGYHKTIIVDHGDNYYTLYAQVEKSLVALGDKVNTQQVIARAGKGTRYKTSGLYFEFRHFSEAINPEHWLESEVRFKKASLSKEI